jgi:hypothetical protein
LNHSLNQFLKMYKFLFLLLAFYCVKENKEFDWLSGDWQRINDTASQKTFENWQSEADGSLSGIGFTLEGIDTVFVEQLAIKKTEEKWQLIVTGVHEEPTYFDVTSFNGN